MIYTSVRLDISFRIKSYKFRIRHGRVMRSGGTPGDSVGRKRWSGRPLPTASQCANRKTHAACVAGLRRNDMDASHPLMVEGGRVESDPRGPTASTVPNGKSKLFASKPEGP